MWFKQLSFFRLGPDAAPSVDALSAALAKRPFQPCGGLDWESTGWVPPTKTADGHVFSTRGYHLVALQTEKRVLPASVIRDALDAKVAEIEDKELRKVGRKEKQALKEQLTDDLLPRSFTTRSRTRAYLDLAQGWAMVGHATASKAEAVISQLREALPPFPAALPRTQQAPHAAMTAWLLEGEAPNGFELDADCDLTEASENAAVVRCSRMDLTAEEIRQHIASGKQVTKLGLIWRERIRFVLTDTLQLKRLQFLDVLQQEASQSGDDAAALAEATFLLMAEELGELVDELVDALGGLEDSQAQTPTPQTSHATAPVAEVPWD